MRLSVMICDDLEEARISLARMVRRACGSRRIDLDLELSSSGEELLDRFRTRRWDVLFLDIYLGGISGAQAARIIRAQDPTCALIFATTSREHGLLSYELQVTDYLLKPFNQTDVDAVLDWLLLEREERFQTITIRSEWEEEEILVREIQYIEVISHTAEVHLAAGVKRTRKGLHELENEISDSSFLHCHRSFLVNLNHVTAISGGFFSMKNGDRVPISASRASAVKRAFFDWSLEKSWSGPSDGPDLSQLFSRNAAK